MRAFFLTDWVSWQSTRDLGLQWRHLSQMLWYASVIGTFLVDQPVGNGCVAVDASIAQKGPVAPDVFECLQIDVANQDLFAVV